MYRNAIDITSANLAELEPEHLISDSIIDFFLKHLYREGLYSLGRPGNKEFLFIRCLFWLELNAISVGNIPQIFFSHHKGIFSSIGNIDIFEKKFLFVPIVMKYVLPRITLDTAPSAQED